VAYLRVLDQSREQINPVHGRVRRNGARQLHHILDLQALKTTHDTVLLSMHIKVPSKRFALHSIPPAHSKPAIAQRSGKEQLIPGCKGIFWVASGEFTWPPVSASRPSSMCCPRIRPCMLISTIYRPSTRFCARAHKTYQMRIGLYGITSDSLWYNVICNCRECTLLPVHEASN